MKIVKIDPNKKTLMGAVYYLFYQSNDFIKYLYRLMYYGGTVVVMLLWVLALLQHWWLILVIWSVVLYGLVRKTWKFYHFDKAGMYNNTTFANEILSFGGK